MLNSPSPGSPRPLDRICLLGGALLCALSLGCAESTPAEVVTTSEPLTIQEWVDATPDGETAYIPGGEYGESVTLPEGVNLCGEDGAKVVITPPANMPGIVLTPRDAEGTVHPDSDVPGEETGAGERRAEPPSGPGGSGGIIAPAIAPPTSRICNLTVQSATGHGIRSQGVSLELENVKIDDTLRAVDESPGHGVHVEEAASFLAIDVRVTGSTGVGVSVVDVMDVKFTVTDFVATPDPDAIGVVWPEYMPDPETMGASLVSGNDGGGISVVWPEYMPNPDGSAPVQAIAIEGVSVLENGHFGIQVAGCALSLDQTVISGTLLPKASRDPLDMTIANGQGILAKNAISVTMNNCIVEKNAGAGLVSAGSGPLVLGGQNGIPRPSDDDGEEVGVVWPEYLPSNQFLDNAGGGLALLDPIDPDAGKADAPTESCSVIAGVKLSGNDGFGVMAQSACLRIERSLVQDTQSGGDGVRVVEGSRAADVAIDAHSLITGNTGFGARIAGIGILALDSEISKNTFGGAWSRGENATIRVTENARIASNRSLGIAVLDGSLLEVTGAVIEGTHDGQGGEKTSLGDGIWALNAGGVTVKDTTIRGSARCGILLYETALADILLEDIHFQDNLLIMVQLANNPCETSDDEPSVGCLAELPPAPECDGCIYGDDESDREPPDALINGACLEILTCDPSDPECVGVNSCGDCICPEDAICTSANCDPPEETGEEEETSAEEETGEEEDTGEEEETGDEGFNECALASDCPATASCEISQTCVEGKCIPWNEQGEDVAQFLAEGTPCDDGNTCTQTDTCEAGGECTGTADPAGSSCDDGLVCTANDHCTSQGTCQGTPTCAPFLDFDSCTLITACDGPDNCTSATFLSKGAPCDDGNTCTEGETCNDLLTTSPKRCDGGSVLSPGSSCEDGDACTAGDTCSAAASCSSGPGQDCNDGNPCTMNSCDSSTGCTTVKVPDGTPCNDDDPCLGPDTCQNGGCTSGTLAECGEEDTEEGGSVTSGGGDQEACPGIGFAQCSEEENDGCANLVSEEGATWLGAIQTCLGEFISEEGCQCLLVDDVSSQCNAQAQGTSTGDCFSAFPGNPLTTLCIAQDSGGQAPLGKVNLNLGNGTILAGKIRIYHHDDIHACENGLLLHNADGTLFECNVDSYALQSGQPVCVPTTMTLPELNAVDCSDGLSCDSANWHSGGLIPILIPHVPIAQLIEADTALFLCAEYIYSGGPTNDCTGDVVLLAIPVPENDPEGPPQPGTACTSDADCPIGQICEDNVICVPE